MSIEENEKRLIGLKKTSCYEGKELVICLDNASKVKFVLDFEFWSNKSQAKKRSYNNWYYIFCRIERILAHNTYSTIEEATEQLAILLFADHKADGVRIIQHEVDGASSEQSFVFLRRAVKLGPTPKTGHQLCVFLVRCYGNFIKALARPFHWLLPNKRWTMPESSSAKRLAQTESEIPRVIWQTNFTNKCSFPVWVNYIRNRRLSNDFEHRYVSTEDREKYVIEHAAPRVYEVYKKLADGAAQADLWRVITLYEEGGIYMDIDATLVRPLSKIIEDKEYVFLWDKKRFSNYFLATKPKNPIFAQFIEEIVNRVENFDKERDKTVFYVTGPGALESVLDTIPNIEYTPYQAIAGQGLFTDEKYQYIDRPNTKWTHNKNFIK